MNKVFKVVGNIILDLLIVILIIALGFAVNSFVQVKVMNKGYSNCFGYTYFHILTGSMEKTIMVDDYVFVKVTKDIKENDIISFKYENDIVTHRVVSIEEDTIQTKGDNNNTVDNPITEDQVIGKVVYIGKNFGKFKKLVTNPIVFVPFLAAVVLFSIYFKMLTKERSEQVEK